MFSVLDYGKLYLEFLLVIVQKCKCDFGVLYVKYFFDVTGHTKTRLNTRSSATSIFFMNCLSATTSVAFSVLDYGK